MGYELIVDVAQRPLQVHSERVRLAGYLVHARWMGPRHSVPRKLERHRNGLGAHGIQRLPSRDLFGQAHGTAQSSQQAIEVQRHVEGYPLFHAHRSQRRVLLRQPAGEKLIAESGAEPAVGDRGHVAELAADAPFAPLPPLRIPVQLLLVETTNVVGDKNVKGGQPLRQSASGRGLEASLAGHESMPIEAALTTWTSRRSRSVSTPLRRCCRHRRGWWSR